MNNITTNQGEAILNNDERFTCFSFGKKNIRFKTPYSLERYTDVKEWNNGHLVVLAKYSHKDKPIEEYINLVPILENLYIKPDEFLLPIKTVRISYD